MEHVSGRNLLSRSPFGAAVCHCIEFGELVNAMYKICILISGADAEPRKSEIASKQGRYFELLLTLRQRLGSEPCKLATCGLHILPRYVRQKELHSFRLIASIDRQMQSRPSLFWRDFVEVLAPFLQSLQYPDVAVLHRKCEGSLPSIVSLAKEPSVSLKQYLQYPDLVVYTCYVKTSTTVDISDPDVNTVGGQKCPHDLCIAVLCC